MGSYFLDGVNDPINTGASISTIHDNFDAGTIEPARWNLPASHGYSDVDGRLDLDPTDSYIVSFEVWSLPVSAAVYVRSWPDTGTGDSFFGIATPEGDTIEFRYTGGTLHFNCSSPVETSSISYDDVAHAWWRIRREGAQIAFYTAPTSGNLVGPGSWTRRYLTTLSPDFLEEQNFFVYAGASG
jgi:hypothetical protein